MNVIYTVIRILAVLILTSVWYLSLAVYYACLSAVRFMLVRYIHSDDSEKNLAAAWKRYRQCGVMMLVLNQVLTAIVVYIVHNNAGFEFPGVTIYAMAVYAFYALTMAIISMVRFRRFENPIVSADRAINLCAALVTVLAMETAMITQFGDRNGEFAHYMITGSGAVVCIIVLCIAVLMIVRGTSHIRKTEHN